MWDGDAVFSLGTGTVETPQSTLERMAMRAVAEAIRRGVRLAEALGGVPAVGEET
jgi:L-aminopeptidase/D-esterase-like protein